MKFRPEVEGLRAVAIIPVVLCHAARGLKPGGFVGVDVFFIISGYLIVGNIAGELNAGRFSPASFWRPYPGVSLSAHSAGSPLRPLAGGRFFPLGPAAAACFGALAAAAVAADGELQRFSPAALTMFQYSKSYNPRRPECHEEDYRVIPYERSCMYGAPNAEPDAALWGDSYGAELAVGLGELAQRSGRAAMQLTSLACPRAMRYSPIIRRNCAAHNEAMMRKLAADRRTTGVILVADYEE